MLILLDTQDSFSEPEISQYKASPEKFPQHLSLFNALDQVKFPKDCWPGIQGPNVARTRYAHPGINDVDRERLIDLYIGAFETTSTESRSLKEVITWEKRFNSNSD